MIFAKVSKADPVQAATQWLDRWGDKVPADAAMYIDALIGECERLRTHMGSSRSHLLTQLKIEQLKNAELQIQIARLLIIHPRSLNLCDEQGKVLATYEIADKADQL